MLYKTKTLFLTLLLLVQPLITYTHQSNITLKLAPKDITAFFVNGAKVVELLNAMNKNDKDQLYLVCCGCKTNKLYCAELAGHLSGQNGHMEQLKQLLVQKKVSDIKKFMLTVAQSNQISCTTCEKFIAWV